MKYIKTGRIQAIIAQSDEENRPLYLLGPIGCGKTAALEYYYRRRSHQTIDCAEGSIAVKTDPSKIRSNVIIFDNVTYLNDESSIRYVLDFMRSSGKHIIFTGRSSRPAWLISSAADKDMIVADQRDMIFRKEEVFKLLELYGIQLSEDNMYRLMEESRFNPLLLKIIAFYMREEGSYTDDINQMIRTGWHNYLEKELTGRFTEEETEFLLAICKYPRLTVDMARTLNHGHDVRAVVDSIIRKNAYVLTSTYSTIELSNIVINFLDCKRDNEWPKEKSNENLCIAAEYYLKNNNIRNALYYYQRGEACDQAVHLLEQYAAEHPDAVSVYYMKDMYDNLPEEKIHGSWPLISAFCMLESVMIHPRKSEAWYEELKSQYETETDISVKEEINRRIVYLDMMLPHRGLHNMEERNRKAAELFRNQGSGPDFTYADLMPTVLHGSIDLSEMTKDEKELYRLSENIVSSMDGVSPAMIDILKAEIGYEKDSMDHFEMIKLLNKGYAEADADNSLSGCFASVGVSVHLHLFRGEMERAEELLDGIRRKSVDEKNDVLLGNIDALYGWVDQLHANRENVQTWLETAPDENIGFSFFQRSEMLCKVRAYIILGRFDAALALTERLLAFFEMYERTYAYYEALIYKAIIYYRMKNPEWETVMRTVLKKTAELGFYRIVSDNGIAVLPLLEKMKSEGIPKPYFEHLKQLTGSMAENYPNYLITVEKLTETLTKTERRVLHLLCEGLNADEICTLMQISYSGIKFHNKNIYRKLGANNRTEAVRIAFKLGLNQLGTND